MTQAELRDSWYAEAGMAAEDCKTSAEYAAYALKNRDRGAGGRYVANLKENLGRLETLLSMVDRAEKKIAAGEP